MGLLNRCIAAAALAALPAVAHVTLEKPSAEAGTYYKATFMVGHGCAGGSPMTALTVRFPADIKTARPGVKPGWTIDIKRDPFEVTWTGGPLPADYYDEFIVQVRLPDTPGKRYFAVKQTCEDGTLEWNEIPEAGKTRRDYKQPAAELDVVPKKAAGEEHRH
jgi:uncharacterized protein YcnI